MKGIIYKATCKTNNKSYIGETMRGLPKRIETHFNYANCKTTKNYKFQRAILKHGESNFVWEVLEEVFATSKTELKKILLQKEAEYIAKFDSYHDGYNSLLQQTNMDDVYYLNDVVIDKQEYLEFCSQGNGRAKQAKHFKCSESQIKQYRKYLCDEEPELRQTLNQYDNIVNAIALKNRNTYVAYGKDNPGYIEININMNEYISKAKEGLNRQQLANHFKISDSQMKIWRRRKIAEDSKNIALFKELDTYRKNIGTANANKLINRLPKDIIEKVEHLTKQGKSMNQICKIMNIKFGTIRTIRETLGLTPRKNAV
jgi:hypothetical protein